MPTLTKVFLLLVFAWCAMAPDVCAQHGVPSVHKSNGSYADLYKQQLKTSHRTGMSAREYTINKQFRGNPNLSPYLNLARPQQGRYTPNYQAYVKPELARRQKAQAKGNRYPQPGRPAGSRSSASGGNPYYSKYYTGR